MLDLTSQGTKLDQKDPEIIVQVQRRYKRALKAKIQVKLTQGIATILLAETESAVIPQPLY